MQTEEEMKGGRRRWRTVEARLVRERFASRGEDHAACQLQTTRTAMRFERGCEALA
jgi:hypothetical protein